MPPRQQHIYRTVNFHLLCSKFLTWGSFSGQGTAGVALAGLLGAVRAMGYPMEDIVKQKIVVVGAGR